MGSWDQDEFMSQWDKRYVSTNVKLGSPAYDPAFFAGLNRDLLSSQSELENVSCALIVRLLFACIMSCY